MKRRTFIRNTSLSLGSFVLIPSLVQRFVSDEITDEDLMGRTPLTFRSQKVKLRNEAYECFALMSEAASKEGIQLRSVSSYRNYDHQKQIWNRKYKAYTESGLSPVEAMKKIIEYSTMPGTSRHHWGTDIDIIDATVKAPENVLSPKHFESGRPFHKLKLWMDKHAEEFGFYLVYTQDENREGFKYEPWHFSYKPISVEFLKQYVERKIFTKAIAMDILGKEHMTEDFIEHYYQKNILDINPQLL